MNKHQKARWENAQRIGNKLKSLLDDGIILYNEDGDRVMDIEVDDTGFYEVMGNCKIMYFINDTELDNGMYTSIKEFNKLFDGWTYVDPSHRKKIQL